MAVPIRRADAIVLGAIALAVAATGGALLALGGAAAPAWLGEVTSWTFANGWDCLTAAVRGGECPATPAAPNEAVAATAGLTLLAAAGGLLVSAIDQAADSAADREGE